jgi:HCNGP-like protein
MMTGLAYTNSLIRQVTMPILPPDMEDFGIPPSPPGSPPPELKKKFDHFRELRERGVYFNDRLGENKGFRNPKLLERLRGYVGVEDQYGSQLPTNVWDPHNFPPEHYHDKLGMSFAVMS